MYPRLVAGAFQWLLVGLVSSDLDRNIECDSDCFWMLLVPIANMMFPFFEDPNDLLKYSPCKKEVTASHELAKWFERIALPNNLGYSKRLIASHFHSRFFP